MSFFVDIDYRSINKYGEELCGDQIEVIRRPDSVNIVLADGLGSGVKANILSTLTSKIICTMLSNGMTIDESVETIANTLPVCSQRGIAYSTFTILQIFNSGKAYMVQFDNPSVVLLKNGLLAEYDMERRDIYGKTIYESRFDVAVGDMFVMFSDGVVHAGIGKTLNLGWQMEDIQYYITTNYDSNKSAGDMACTLIEAVNNLYINMPGDDSTAAVVGIRENLSVNLMVGPPVDQHNDKKAVDLLMRGDCKRVVCGGTTSQIVSKHLNKELDVALQYEDTDIPPMGYIDGIDLVTEGVLTLNKVLENSKAFLAHKGDVAAVSKKKDGASRISDMLFKQATNIFFIVGHAINFAHQNSPFAKELSIKMKIVDELAENLKKMGKHVQVQYL